MIHIGAGEDCVAHGHNGTGRSLSYQCPILFCVQTSERQNMMRGEILENVEDRFAGKTDAQILRELAASWGHPGIVLPDDESGRASMPGDEAEAEFTGLLT
jgi:hypothetical protein